MSVELICHNLSLLPIIHSRHAHVYTRKGKQEPKTQFPSLVLLLKVQLLVLNLIVTRCICLFLRYLKSGPGNLEKDMERRFSYALSREDIENAVLGGP